MDSHTVNELLRTIFAGVSLILSIGSVIIATLIRRSSATKSAIDRVETKFDERFVNFSEIMGSNHATNVASIGTIREHMSQMNEALKHVPTHNDMSTVRDMMMNVNTTVSHLRGAQEANTRMVERMNSYLMERGT